MIAIAPRTTNDIIFTRRVLAYNIARHRENLDISQAQLADLVGLTQQQVSEIERAKRYITDVCELRAIALALGASFEALFTAPRNLDLLPEYSERKRRRRYGEKVV